MRMIRAVKTGLLVTFIAGSGIAPAQDETPPPPQFSTQDEAGPQGAAPQNAAPPPMPPQAMPPQAMPTQGTAQQNSGPQMADQNPSTQDNQGWRRLGPAPYPQTGVDPRYAQPGPQYGDP